MRFLIVLCLLALTIAAFAAAPDIPSLNWQERSNWLNVKTDVTPKALGDGVADDTRAIQTALDTGGDGKAIYLPPGTYRITQTLVLKGPIHGVLIVGHGRDTKLVWDGAEGGTMFWSNGSAYSSYIGLSWDGRNKAAVGFEHASEKRFETEVRHEHEAFRNFTGYGIRVGYEQKVASAEINYLNCLFENCGTGAAFLAFNDYDNSFDGCEFRDCGTGIFDTHSNFYVRNSHFERSRVTDFSIGSEHGSSIRRCTSYGSQRFVTEAGIAPVTIQDCHVAAWKDPASAVQLNGAPLLMFDCVFTEPPSANPPVKALNSSQRLLLSANRPAAVEKLVAGCTPTDLPTGKFTGVIKDAHQTFLRSTAAVPSKVFDARTDFGAKGDGKTDDTQAIQSAIDAARKYGKDALAYLPPGYYVITRSLRITGSDYRFGGGGFYTRIVWRGPEDGVGIDITDPQRITLEQFAIGHHDLGPIKCLADIRQSSTGGPSSICYDAVWAYGMYQKQPDKQGILFENLSPQSVVRGPHVQGNLRFRDCAQAKFLFAQSYEGTVSVEGKSPKRDGLLGFMFRLTTIVNPSVWLRDNQSIVMSDLYAEQSDSYLRLQGAPADPPGHATITGPKIHLNTQEPVLQADGYSGRVLLGMDQFYLEPKTERFVTTGDTPLQLTLMGNLWYNTTADLKLSPATKLVCLANAPFGEGQPPKDAGLDQPGALAAISQALDDLRRLGYLDHQVNGWVK